ncbi:MAG: cytochrome-c peroxidase [Bacteroidia bacterium]
MKTIHRILFFCFTFLLLGAAWYTDADIKFAQPKGWPKPHYDLSKNKITRNGFELGKLLFFDQILSRDSSTSCASCHVQFTGFTHIDHALSHGIDGLKGTRNSPVIFNMAWAPSFMWDGGVNHLDAQPIAPITNKVEMDNTLENVIKKLSTQHYYRIRFYKAFGDSNITTQKTMFALSQFVLMLESYNSKYDKVKRKEKGETFTDREKKGYELFLKNCNACHKEPLFTDYSFQNNGLKPDPQLNDFGRFKITKSPEDSLKFKVPSLRNIAVSFPYMHDGRFRDLKQVLNHYTNELYLSRTTSPLLSKGITLNDEEKECLIAFLNTLTDKEFLFDVRFRRPNI